MEGKRSSSMNNKIALINQLLDDGERQPWCVAEVEFYQSVDARGATVQKCYFPNILALAGTEPTYLKQEIYGACAKGQLGIGADFVGKILIYVSWYLEWTPQMGHIQAMHPYYREEVA